MSLTPVTLSAIQQQRQLLAEQRQAQAASRAALKQAQAGLEVLARQGAAAGVLAEQQALAEQLDQRARRDAALSRETLLRIGGLQNEVVAGRPPALLVQALPATHPVALLPVAVQTRYNKDATQLMIRIYPDALHAQSHDAGLTPQEIASGKSYWEQRFAAPADAASPWSTIATLYGPGRAAFVVRSLTPTNLALIGQPDPQGAEDALVGPLFDDASVPLATPESGRSVAVALPDRFVAIGTSGGKEIFRKWGAPVPDLLALTPSFDPLDQPKPPPGQPLAPVDPFSGDCAWLVDYAAALSKGMAITITPADLKGVNTLKLTIDRLVVLGVDWSQTADESAAELAELLKGHQQTQGLRLVAHGTPTNNTGSGRSGVAADGSDLLASSEPVAAAARGGAYPEELAPAGARMQQLLGLPGAQFDLSTVAGGDLRDNTTAGHMLNALWSATLGYTLRHFWNPVGSGQALLDDTSLDQLRAWAVRFLRPAGPLNALCTGQQPYGVLPITAGGFLPRANSPVEREVSTAVQWFRGFWEAAVDKVPRLDQPDAASLHQVLSMHPWAQALRYWQVSGPAAVRNDPSLQPYADAQALMIDGLVRQLLEKQLNGTPYIATCATTPLAHTLDAVPWVQRDDKGNEREGDQALNPNYIATLHSLTRGQPTKLRAQLVAMQNADALLQALLAFAADEELTRSGRELFAQHLAKRPGVGAAAKQRARQWRSAEYLGVDDSALVGDQVDLSHHSVLMGMKLVGTTGQFTVEETLASQIGLGVLNFPEYLKNIASFGDSLAWLKSIPAGNLQLALRGTLDLYANRLDAWITALATARLEHLRDQAPSGLHLGAWGVVEDLVPDLLRPASQAKDSHGYVHAPSVQQATAAAILHSGHLANAEAAGNAFDIDLRSLRVRRARRLLEGLANGQSMAALIGYRFERGLRELQLPQHILEFRKAFPLRPSGSQPSDEPGEAIAARDVVDGVRLLDAARLGTLALLGSLPATDQTKVKALLAELRDQVDAVSDLMVSESVFQLAGGNLAGAGAAMKALDKQQRPPEARVIQSPRSSRGYTQRVVVALQTSEAADWAAFSADDLSARVEPRLNAWLARLLGDPGRYAFAARVLERQDNNGDPQWVDKAVPLSASLAELGLSPLALVLRSEADQGGGASGFQERLGAVFEAKVKAQFGAASDQMAVVLEGGPPPGSPAGTPGLTHFESLCWLLRGLLEKARPLRRMDLVLATDGTESQALLQDGVHAGVDVAELATRMALAEAPAQAALGLLDAAVAATNQALADALAALDAAAQPRPDNPYVLLPAQGALAQQLAAALAAAHALGWRNAVATQAASEGAGGVGAAQAGLVAPHDSLERAAARARSLSVELSARLQAAPAPPAGAARAVATAALIERIQAILGKSHPVLPLFTLGDYAGEAALSLAARDTLLGKTSLGNDDMAIAGWLPKLGAVREGLGRLNDVLCAAESTGGRPMAAADCKLMQFPHQPDPTRPEHWAALPLAAGQELRGTVAVVAHAPEALDALVPDSLLAGLFIDEWAESLPSADQTTGLSFHFDAPGARPPQSILLAVPANPATEAWTLDALLATVNEAMALARLRAVRPQDLNGLGLVLPALMLSSNVTNDVASVDLNGMVARNIGQLLKQAGISGNTRVSLAEGKTRFTV